MAAVARGPRGSVAAAHRRGGTGGRRRGGAGRRRREGGVTGRRAVAAVGRTGEAAVDVSVDSVPMEVVSAVLMEVAAAGNNDTNAPRFAVVGRRRQRAAGTTATPVPLTGERMPPLHGDPGFVAACIHGCQGRGRGCFHGGRGRGRDRVHGGRARRQYFRRRPYFWHHSGANSGRYAEKVDLDDGSFSRSPTVETIVDIEEDQTNKEQQRNYSELQRLLSFFEAPLGR